MIVQRRQGQAKGGALARAPAEAEPLQSPLFPLLVRSEMAWKFLHASVIAIAGSFLFVGLVARRIAGLRAIIEPRGAG
jgi:hypothetical protein